MIKAMARLEEMVRESCTSGRTIRAFKITRLAIEEVRRRNTRVDQRTCTAAVNVFPVGSTSDKVLAPLLPPENLAFTEEDCHLHV